MQTLTYHAPNKLEKGVPADAFIAYQSLITEECAICQDTLSMGESVMLSVCKHCFHADCIRQALKASAQCPICRKAIGEPRGKSPSGTMEISRSSNPCSGYPGVGSVVIDYRMESGLQKEYHDNPGQFQPGKAAR